jgi:peptidyl-tRNA hydrolase, PTH1 family
MEGNAQVRLIVGLGNPGPDYARTRHNIGFRCLDLLAKRHGLEFGRVKDGCMAAEGRIKGHSVVLVKPLRYMNVSGEALSVWAARRSLAIGAPDPALDPDDDCQPAEQPVMPLVIVDDIALPLGSLRLRARGSDGGHNGLASLAKALGGEDYPRMRLGVAPDEDAVPTELWKNFVLESFEGGEWDVSEDLIAHACDAVEAYLEHGVDWTGSRFNRRIRKPDPEPQAEDLQTEAE